MRGWAWLVMVVVGGAGCATTPKWAAATTAAEEKFPPRAELQKLAETPPKLDTAKYDRAAIDSWTLVGPFPSEASVTLVKPSNPWEQALAAGAPAVGNVLAVDAQCIAREVARFYVVRDDYPGKSLQAFIERRCGTLSPQVHLHATHGKVSASTKDDAWLADWKDDVVKAAKAMGSPDVAGIAAVREGEKAVVVLVTADAGARLSAPIPLIGSNGTVVLRGRLARGGAERISALINKGALEVEDCKTLDALTPPEFAFECPVDLNDVRTTLEVAAFDQGRILGREVFTVSLWPKGTASATWERPKGSTDVPAGEFDERFLAAVNAMRSNAKLPVLTLSKSQSATAALLAPHYFAASFGQEDELEADRVALGMMAGWDVGMDIVSSGFGSMWLSGTRDLSLFLEFVLDDPFTRKSVTEPRATQLAVGSLTDTSSSLAAIFGTYVPLGKFDRKESEIAIITRLNQMRLDRKLGLAQWTLWPEDEGAVVERNLTSKRWGPDDASQYVLNKTAEVAKGSVRGYVQLVDDLDNFQFPPEVLMRPNVNVFLSVGVYRDEKWAHSRYVVCFVLANNADIETASR